MNQTRPRITPRSFFLQLAAVAAFYVSAVSFIALLFQYIDALFPDQLQYYYNAYSGGIRWAIAALIVIFPTYIWLQRTANNDLEREPEGESQGLRRWLIYLTLFAAGLSIIIDLISLINVFLGGELTARFVLKALSVLAVAAAAFGYYLADLHGYWLRKRSASKSVGWAALAVVLVSVASGFFIIGSPQTARALRFDQTRVSDLSNIQWQIVNFWQSKERLPENLAELNDPLVGFIAPTDPESGETYAYEKKANLSFELCADFNLPTPENAGASYAYPLEKMPADGINGNWQHGEGKVCFERTIDPERFPPVSRRL